MADKKGVNDPKMLSDKQLDKKKEVRFSPSEYKFKTIAEALAELEARVTVNDLVEFQNCTPKGRKAIVRATIKKLNDKKAGQKTDGGHYYVRALSGMKKAQEKSSLTPLFNKIKEVRDDIPNTPKKRTRDRWASNINAMEEYQKTHWHPEYTQAKKNYIGTGSENGKFVFHGLDISVRPELVYKSVIKGEKVVGASKFVIKLPHAKFKREQSELVALLTYLYAEFMCVEGETPAICYAVDVYRHECVPCPIDLEFAKSKLKKLVIEYLETWKQVIAE